MTAAEARVRMERLAMAKAVYIEMESSAPGKLIEVIAALSELASMAGGERGFTTVLGYTPSGTTTFLRCKKYDEDTYCHGYSGPALAAVQRMTDR